MQVTQGKPAVVTGPLAFGDFDDIEVETKDSGAVIAAIRHLDQDNNGVDLTIESYFEDGDIVELIEFLVQIQDVLARRANTIEL